MKISALLRVSLAAAAFSAVVPGIAAADASPAPTTSTAPAASPAATVDTKNFAYGPDPVTVKPGDTVLFKNSDALAHTVTAEDKSFDSSKMDGGTTWSHVFATAGTYKYFCVYHSYMRGTVIVKAP
jgi:plastocyanin